METQRCNTFSPSPLPAVYCTLYGGFGDSSPYRDNPDVSVLQVTAPLCTLALRGLDKALQSTSLSVTHSENRGGREEKTGKEGDRHRENVPGLTPLLWA